MITPSLLQLMKMMMMMKKKKITMIFIITALLAAGCWLSGPAKHEPPNPILSPSGLDLGVLDSCLPLLRSVLTPVRLSGAERGGGGGRTMPGTLRVWQLLCPKSRVEKKELQQN